jgi:hypothetical protein
VFRKGGLKMSERTLYVCDKCGKETADMNGWVHVGTIWVTHDHYRWNLDIMSKEELLMTHKDFCSIECASNSIKENYEKATNVKPELKKKGLF